jgi:hypothetical protein
MNLHMKGLILALGAAAGLLAIGAPMTAQASTHPVVAAHGQAGARGSLAPAVRQLHRPGAVANVNSNGATSYIGNCTFVVGDHAESNRYASGEADIRCPAAETYHVHVYLDYEWNGKWYTATSYATNEYWPSGTYWDTWTAGVCSTSGAPENLYWQTAAEISFNNGPTYKWYYSVPNYWTIPACS